MVRTWRQVHDSRIILFSTFFAALRMSQASGRATKRGEILLSLRSLRTTWLRRRHFLTEQVLVLSHEGLCPEAPRWVVTG